MSALLVDWHCVALKRAVKEWTHARPADVCAVVWLAFKIIGYHSNVAEESRLPGCDAASLVEWTPTFREIITVHLQGQAILDCNV